MAYIQSKGNSAAGPTLAATFDTNVTAGSLIIATMRWNDTNGTIDRVASVADSVGTGYSLALFTPHGAGLCGVTSYIGIAPTGNANTVTVTWTASQSFAAITITEVSQTTVLNASAGGVGQSTAADSGTATTSAPAFLYGYVGTDNGTDTITAGVNEAYTKRQDYTSGIGKEATEDALKAAGGSTAAQFTISAIRYWECQLLAFASPAGVPVDTDYLLTFVVQR